MMTPTSMEPSPAKRNSRSWTSSSRAKARFTPRGLRKGAMPSNTRNRPSAARRSERLIDTKSRRGQRRLVPRRRALRRARRVLQVAEEFPIGGEDQKIAVLAECVLVGLEAAIEGVELRIARIGARVD